MTAVLYHCKQYQDAIKELDDAWVEINRVELVGLGHFIEVDAEGWVCADIARLECGEVVSQRRLVSSHIIALNDHENLSYDNDYNERAPYSPELNFLTSK